VVIHPKFRYTTDQLLRMACHDAIRDREAYLEAIHHCHKKLNALPEETDWDEIKAKTELYIKQLRELIKRRGW
jgi:hypothetical protein